MNMVRSSWRVVQEVIGISLAGGDQMTNGEGLMLEPEIGCWSSIRSSTGA